MAEDPREIIRRRVQETRQRQAEQDRMAELCDVVRIALARNDGAEAVRAAESLLEAYPESTTAHELMGDALMLAGKRTRAKDEYKRAMEIEPANADAERKFAEAMLFIGQVERTRDILTSGDISMLRGAVHKDPKHAAMRSVLFPGLGQLYNGDYERGVITVLLAFVLFGLAAWGIMEFFTSAVITSSDPMSAGEIVGALVGCIGYVSLLGWSVWDAQRSSGEESAPTIDPDAVRK
ncbi:MAG: hypothetical protein KBI47_04055 [Armatimonadetes bacterium]|jgi:tetratricopeptide (TPR) repeat protein|nr:hypothetical protein [Armatimonadota bacterium]MDI9585654.1 hypothetical protein [Acidobacteriota bacterium]